MGARACPNCGHPLSTNARFCVNCGQTLPDEVQVAVAERERVPWRASEALGVFLIVFVATAIAELLLAIFIPNDKVVVVGLMLNEALLLGTLLTWVRRRHGVGLRELGLRDVTASNVGAGIAVGIAGLLLAQIVGTIVVNVAQNVAGHAIEQPKQIPLQNSPSTAMLVLLGVSVIVFAPLAEELFFRGFLFRGLRNWMRAGPAIVLSAAIFAISHVVPLVILPIFALGMLLAGVVERRGSLVPSMVAHATFNTFGFVVGFVLKK
jgi:membrane protease YdiL (CAAX protease family)